MSVKIFLIVWLGFTLCGGAVLPPTTTKATTTTKVPATTTKATTTTKLPTTTTKAPTTTTKTTTKLPTATTKTTTKLPTTTTKATTTTKLPSTTTKPPTTTTTTTTATTTTTEIPTTTVVSSCTYNGKTYAINEQFSPDPCTFCWCMEGGQHMCAMMSCMACEYRNSLYIPGQCCPVCQTTPFQPPTTTVGFCEYEGKQYAVGQSFSPNPCAYCFCEEGGEVQCALAGCPYCEGQIVEVPGQCCHYCIPMTPKIPTCEYNGKTFALGDSFSPDPCTHCYCESPGEPVCMVAGCAYCEGEAVYVPGQCCPECVPRTPPPAYCVDGGKTYQVGESFFPNPCAYCYCGDGGLVQCAYAGCPSCPGESVHVPGQCCPTCYTTPEIPTSTPALCQSNGKTYSVGESYWSDPCTQCACQRDGPMCYVRDCAPPQCANYYFVPGECCPKCPPNSETPSPPQSPPEPYNAPEPLP